ncbi:GH11428 [Drosophila grimshawi]|uniref:Large ribosomal subunit protein uL4m n=1 Tax=Drosophila grimshawi TaxID=7222 RepID=B4JAB3_DROGR|nr:GH11428 [Drosophila grimshawi]
MDGFDEKRRSMKQELLRRALLLKVENSKERSALYDVPTTRCSTQPRGIPLTKEPQLVRNMQRNFSNSRWEPLPGTGLAQREIAGCLECGEATPKKLCLKCRAKEKGYRGSRASSLNYPSSWNLEMVEDSQVVDGRSAELSPSDITNCDALHRTIYDQRLADHSGGANHQKKIDNCVQCSLRPMTKSSTMEPTIEDNSRIRQVLEKPKQRMRHKSVQSDMGYVSKQVSSSPDIVRMEHVIDASGFGKQRVFSGEAGGQSENACSCCCVWGKYPSPGSTHATNAAGISRNNDGYTSSAIDSRASNDNETIKNQQKVGEMHYPTSEHLKIIEHISRPPTMMDTTIPIRKSDSVTQQEKYESNQNGVSRMDYVPNSRERSNEKKKISSRNESYEQYSYNPSNESLSHKQAAVNSSIQCPCCSNAMTQTEEIRQKLDETAGSKRRQSVNLVKTGHKGSKRRQFKKGAPPHPLNGVQPSPRGNELLPISRTAPTIKQTGKQIPNYSTIKTQQFQSSSLPECIVVRGNHLAENCCQFQIRNCCKPITKQPASSNPFIQLHKSCQCPACIKCRTKATMPTINPSRKPNDDQMAKEKLEKVKTTEPESSMPKYDVKVTSAKAKIQPNKAPENSYPDAKSPVTSRSKANSNPSSTYSDASIKTCQSDASVKATSSEAGVTKPDLILPQNYAQFSPVNRNSARQVWIENVDAVKERKVGMMELHPDVFAAQPRVDIIQENIEWQRKYRYVSMAHTKTRAEVRGGGRKPWPQKGMGRARHGSIRSPLFKGGGIVHGPRSPTSHFYMLPFYTRVLGLTSTLSVKLAQDDLHIIENVELPTRDAQFIRDLIAERNWGPSVLIIDKQEMFPENICYATDSIGYVNLMPSFGLNVYSMLKHDTLVLTVEAVKHLEQRLLYQLHRNDAASKSLKFKLDQV